MKKRKTRAIKQPKPTRDTWAPTTAGQGRLAIFSPTSKPTTLTPKKILKNGKMVDGPWPADVEVQIPTGKWGDRAVIRHYRPTHRDKCIIMAIFKVGTFPIAGPANHGCVDFDIKAVAKVAGCPRHPEWMIDEIIRISRAEIHVYDKSNKLKHWFRVLSQLDILDDDEKFARVYFTPGYMDLWRTDTWIHCERLVEEIAKIKSPVVRAIIDRNLTHGIDFDETLEQALEGVDAMRVDEREQRRRKAEVRNNAKILARFGITYYIRETTGVEHLAFERAALDKDGLVQLDPPETTVAAASSEPPTPRNVKAGPRGRQPKAA